MLCGVRYISDVLDQNIPAGCFVSRPSVSGPFEAGPFVPGPFEDGRFVGAPRGTEDQKAVLQIRIIIIQIRIPLFTMMNIRKMSFTLQSQLKF
jgi:hypothetical protein